VIIQTHIDILTCHYHILPHFTDTTLGDALPGTSPRGWSICCDSFSTFDRGLPLCPYLIGLVMVPRYWFSFSARLILLHCLSDGGGMEEMELHWHSTSFYSGSDSMALPLELMFDSEETHRFIHSGIWCWRYHSLWHDQACMVIPLWHLLMHYR